MSRLLIPLALLVFLSNPLLAEDPVYFADENLKAAVEEVLWTPDPTPTQMLDLFSLDASYRKVTSLKGIEYATNLTSLDACVNEINDASVLSALTGLRILILNNNKITDLSPLSGLTNLIELDVHDNGVEDLSPIAGLIGLEHLTMRRNWISDLSPLSGMTHLHHLDLHLNYRLHNLRENQITDISPLTTLIALDELYLGRNPLNEEACDIYLPQIQLNNPGAGLHHDRCGGRRVTFSSTAGGTVTSPGEGEFIYDNAERIRLEAKADPCFAFARWSGTYPDAGNPTWVTITDDGSIRANFISVSNPLYVDDDAAGAPGQNGSPDHPFDGIQKAIEVTSRSTTVIVRPGTYRENIVFLGKRIRVTGFDPANPCAPYPVIEGTGAAPAVQFVNSEDQNSILDGFVITGNQGGLSQEAVLCSGSSPRITHCLIAGHRITKRDTGVVSCVDSNAVFVNCTIADNGAGTGGAGLLLR